MDDCHVTVAVRLLAFTASSSSTAEAPNEEGNEAIRLEEGDKRGSLKMTLEKCNEPHPSTASNSTLVFDEVYSSSSETQEQDIYKTRISPFVNTVLEGFNGTVISLGNHSTPDASIQKGFITRAARQIFHTLKRLRRSGVTANLVVPCTFTMLCEETLYDLFHQLPNRKEEEMGESKETPTLEMNQSFQCITSEAKGVNDVKKLLEHGQSMMEKYLQSHSTDSLHHTVFTIGVKYSEFGSLFSPISGTLSFACVGKPDSLDVEQLIASSQPPVASIQGLRDFFLTIQKLTQASPILPGTPELAHRSTVTTQKDSKLKILLKEALGGNCKTLVIYNIPNTIHSSIHEQTLSVLKLLSRARSIVNKPDKTELAKEALMEAYMKELRKLYGGAAGKSDTGQLGAVSSDNKDAGMAAKALATAIREDNEYEDSDSEEDEMSLDESNLSGANSSTKSKKKRRFTLSMSGAFESANSQQSSKDFTIEALVAVIQEPDTGVPRALTGALEDVKIHRGKGAVFSGADIVTWLVSNVAGVKSEEDAEQIGQILLDKGAIFHSEGSSVFFNSAYLFYYAKESRRLAKPISQEEIQALLGKEPVDQVLTVNGNKQQNRGDMKSLKREQSFSVEETIKPMSPQPVNDHLSSPVSSPVSPVMLPPIQRPSSMTENSLEASVLTATLVPQNLPDIGDKNIDDKNIGDGNTEETDCPSVEATLVPQVAQEEPMPNEASGGGASESQGKQDKDDDGMEDDERVKTPSSETRPNVRAIEKIPDLQTLENCSDYPHPLHYQAATKNEAGVIKHLINWYGVDQFDDRDRTPLMFAALGNKATSCRTLLECGAVPDRRDKSGLTAVHIACYHGHREVLSVLASKGANIAIRDKMMHTAFHWSVVPESTQCLRIILKHSGKSTLEKEEDKSGLTPIHWAIFYNHVEHLKLLLPRCTDLKRSDICGRNFAIYAIQNERLQCLECILKACPNLAVHPDKHKLTPLHHASAIPTTSYLQALVNAMQGSRQPITLDIQDSYGRTPVHYAVLYGHIEILNLLLKYNADCCPKDSSGRSPLTLRKTFGMAHNEDIAQILKSTHSGDDVRRDKEESAVCNII